MRTPARARPWSWTPTSRVRLAPLSPRVSWHPPGTPCWAHLQTRAWACRLQHALPLLWVGTCDAQATQQPSGSDALRGSVPEPGLAVPSPCPSLGSHLGRDSSVPGLCPRACLCVRSYIHLLDITDTSVWQALCWGLGFRMNQGRSLGGWGVNYHDGSERKSSRNRHKCRGGSDGSGRPQGSGQASRRRWPRAGGRSPRRSSQRE